MRLLLYKLSLSLLVYSCGNTGSVSTPVDNGNDSFQRHFSGVWNGSITGGRPHFKDTPLLTLLLAQMDTVVSGEISTSDSAFVLVQIEKGVSTDTTLSFEAVQTGIYAGARVKFVGNLDGKNLAGTWNHANLHNGRWQVSKP